MKRSRLDFRQESVCACYLVRTQYRPHPRQARRCAVEAGEPHMNFAGLEFHRISRTLHNGAIVPITALTENNRWFCRFFFFGSSSFRIDRFRIGLANLG